MFRPLSHLKPTGYLVVILFTLNVAPLNSEDKPEPPKIAMSTPFAVPANGTTKIIVRGWNLNREMQAKSNSADVLLKVTRHDTAPIPNGQDAKQIGDSLIELEVTVPNGFAGETLPIALMAGERESSPYSLLVGGGYPVISEIEPNDGFRQAQLIAVPQIVDGQIHADRNVDVYAVELAAKQRLFVEVIARRQGSGLDSLLTIFDANSRKVASNDDSEGADSKLDATLAAGRYFLVIQDAHDHGGQTHPYRLVVHH